MTKKIIAATTIILVLGLGLIMFAMPSEGDSEIQETFEKLTWEKNYNYPEWLGSEFTSKFKNTTNITKTIKIAYKVIDNDGTTLEEGSSEYISIDPGETKLIELSTSYPSATIDNLKFELIQ